LCVSVLCELQTADEVAKLHGSRLEDWQIKIFRGIIETIAERCV